MDLLKKLLSLLTSYNNHHKFKILKFFFFMFLINVENLQIEDSKIGIQVLINRFNKFYIVWICFHGICLFMLY